MAAHLPNPQLPTALCAPLVCWIVASSPRLSKKNEPGSTRFVLWPYMPMVKPLPLSIKLNPSDPAPGKHTDKAGKRRFSGNKSEMKISGYLGFKLTKRRGSSNNASFATRLLNWCCSKGSTRRSLLLMSCKSMKNGAQGLLLIGLTSVRGGQWTPN